MSEVGNENIAGNLFPVDSAADLFDVFLVDDGVDEQDAGFTQSKVVTFAGYRFGTLFANRVFVDVQRRLERYVIDNKDSLNPKMLYRIPVDCRDYPEFCYRFDRFVDALRAFQKSPQNFITFSWIYDSTVVGDLHRWIFGFDAENMKRLKFRDGNVLRQSSVVFSNVIDVEDGGTVAYLDINPAVLPFLLYRGRGIGYSLLDRLVMGRFRNPNSFQVYGMLMDWAGRKNFETVVRYDIADFRKQMDLSDAYTNTKIRERILDPVMKDLEDAGSPVNYTYELVYDPTRVKAKRGRKAAPAAGRKKANVIVFTVDRKYVAVDREAQLDKKLKSIVAVLEKICDPERKHLCREVAMQMVRSGQHETFIKKIGYYFRQVNDGLIKKREFDNTLLKISRELTGVDLRSDRHVRNAARRARKEGSAGAADDGVKDAGTLFG